MYKRGCVVKIAKRLKKRKNEKQIKKERSLLIEIVIQIRKLYELF